MWSPKRECRRSYAHKVYRHSSILNIFLNGIFLVRSSRSVRRGRRPYAAWWRNRILIKISILLQAVHFQLICFIRRRLSLCFVSVRRVINKIFYRLMRQTYERRHSTDICMNIYLFISFPSSWMWMSFGAPFITNVRPIHRGTHIEYIYTIYESKNIENWFIFL